VKLRDLIKMNHMNDGTRTLSESIAILEVLQAMMDWKRETGAVGVLIGGCAVSYYAKPRGTTDIDFIFLSDADIPREVKGFKRTRPGAFQHELTHVEVEVVTPAAINISEKLVKTVIDTAENVDGMMIASPSGLVALKLQRLKRYDEGDIIALLETGNVNLNGWPVTPEQLNKLEEIRKKL